MVKEIGGNDYNYVLFQSKTLEEVEAMVPDVVQAIVLPLQVFFFQVIENGACKLIVPETFQLVASQSITPAFQTNDSTAYDELHCLKGLNNFSMYHNERLQQAIQELKPQHPGIAIVYGDYNNAYLWLLCHAHLLCFDVKSVQKACCGVRGEYDFSLTRMCEAPTVPVCGNPHEQINQISTSWPTLFFLLFFLSFFLISFLSFFLLSTPCNTHIFKACKFNTIYQLGDSISDTGNLIRESPQSPFARLPYCRHLWQGFPMEKPKPLSSPPNITHQSCTSKGACVQGASTLGGRRAAGWVERCNNNMPLFLFTSLQLGAIVGALAKHSLSKVRDMAIISLRNLRNNMSDNLRPTSARA
ncbi:hypothetical protein Pint_19648 [Pistacia integerrima]|uniref:Uncharacterized protein n=1 Tax=Pistacia integerrima TaxID=434235 RepID=A0ACC0XCJ0_9ROSI|nr:hypothetical protein Pint_19648 [Pistacia integerrima]